MTKDKKVIQEKRKKILQDHKNSGKTLIPPIKYMLTNLNYVKWLDCVLPEIIWLGLIHEKNGIKRSIELFTCIARANYEINQGMSSTNLALISNYQKLSDIHIQKLLKLLNENGFLQDLQEALIPLIAWYPDCPLNKLINDTKNVSDSSKKIMLQEFKASLKKYLHRSTHLTNLLEVNLAYMSAVSGCVKYVEGVPLPNFDALVTNSPDSSEYKRVAASVRAQTLAHFNLRDIDGQWASYFWNRGLLIDECK